MAIFFAGIIYVAKLLVTGRNPLDKERGMDFWYDVIDWIGGYPYEYALPSEVEAFMRDQGLCFVVALLLKYRPVVTSSYFNIRRIKEKS